jgi:hypothetical protein
MPIWRCFAFHGIDERRASLPEINRFNTKARPLYFGCHNPQKEILLKEIRMLTVSGVMLRLTGPISIARVRACAQRPKKQKFIMGMSIRGIGNPKCKFTKRLFSLALVAVRLLAAVLAVAGMNLYGQGQPQKQPPQPAKSRADETLEAWNEIGNKLIAMAKDFPEDKYDFKVQKEQRTFAQNILHVAAVDYEAIRSVSGSKIGPDFGKDAENPSRDVYKTKTDVVTLIQQAVADGAKVIHEQGDAGLDKITKMPWANSMVHNSFTWMETTEHSGEHYGQLVVYYRANNMVPPESRPK